MKPNKQENRGGVGSDRPDAASNMLCEWVSRSATFVSNLCGALAGIALVAILVIVCAEIIMRQIGVSLLVADEFGAYLNAAVVFLGLAYTLRNGGFIRLEIVYDKLGGTARKVATWLFVVISAVFVCTLLYVAVKHVQYAFIQDTRAISVLETPEWIPQSVMVLGLVALLLQLIAFIFDNVRNVS